MTLFRRSCAVWLPVLLLAGCPAISNADLSRRTDRDGDGFASARYGGDDCDDEDAAVHPGAGEVCDGVDNDCDGLVNADDPDVVDVLVDWYLDADQDAFGSDATYVRSCVALQGWVHVGGDCVDSDPDQKPGQTWYLDGDGDGFGLEGRTRAQCARPDAYTLGFGDCDDANGLISPAATEVCNVFDDDCDGLIDDADPGLEDDAFWYPDLDGDGFGEELAGGFTCDPAGLILIGGDCDDTDPAVRPGAVDVFYDGVDSDCAGNGDYDADGDGHESIAFGGADCDDARSWIHPGAAEICNGQDDDCDAVGWSSIAEAGLAAFVPASGAEAVPVEAVLGSGGTVTVGENGTLFVCEGVWSGSIQITAGDVAVVAPGGAGTAVLDAGYAAVPVTVSGALTNATIDGLTLMNGEAGGASGGCVLAAAVASVALRNTVLEGCHGAVGGGGYLDAASVTVLDSVVIGNDADLGGGGLRISGSTLRVERTTFDDNNGGVGAGGGLLLIANTNPVALTDLNFLSNRAFNGGGIYITRAGAGAATQVTLLRALVDLNLADGDGAGIGTATGISLAIQGDSVLSGNRAMGAGGGLSSSGDAAIVGGDVIDNEAVTGAGIRAVGSVACDSTSILRNDLYGVYVSGAFTSTLCDFGIGADDNPGGDVKPADVVAVSYGTSASFTCTAAGCL